FPHTADVLHVCLATELALGAYLARHAGHLGREGVELVHHRVDGFFELQNLPADVHRDLAREVAARDRGGDVRDVADLTGEVRRHRIDVIGKVLPRASNARHIRL